MISPTLPAELQLGYVHLNVSNLERALKFYEHALGFRLHRRDGGATAYLGAGGPDLVVLTEQPGALRPRRTTGLYHFAILTPSRPALAHSIQHIAETRTPVQGAADHLVSEALYLPDVDGNGIEIYRDRPRAEWRDAAGNFRMDTLPLDLDGLMRELPAAAWTGLAPAPVLGHMHLHVRDIPEARAFYVDV
ncbi:MAG: VOC family protein, partial [Anaerolineales bacterium]|nr:VOC family protein [Anaerolineales bacterium]